MTTSFSDNNNNLLSNSPFKPQLTSPPSSNNQQSGNTIIDTSKWTRPQKKDPTQPTVTTPSLSSASSVTAPSDQTQPPGTAPSLSSTSSSNTVPEQESAEADLTTGKIVNIAQNLNQTDPLTQTLDNAAGPLVTGANESLVRVVDDVSKLLGNFANILNKDITEIGGGILTRDITDIEYKKKLEDIEATAVVTSMIISNAMPGIIQNLGPDAIDPLIQESVSTLAQSLKDASMLVPGIAVFWTTGDLLRAASIIGSAGANIAAAIGQGLIPAGGEYIEVMNMLKAAEAKDREIQEQNLAQNATLGQQPEQDPPGQSDQPEQYQQGQETMQTGGYKRKHKHSTKLIAKRVATSIHRFMETNNIHRNKTKKKVPKNKSSKKRKPIRR